MFSKIHPLLVWSFFVAALTGFLHIAALYLHLYYFIQWIDFPIHFLGGLFIGLSAVYILFLSRAGNIRAGLIFAITIGATILVGVGWEIFERFFDVADAANYFLDTSMDLLADFFGGAAAFAIFVSRLKNLDVRSEWHE